MNKQSIKIALFLAVYISAQSPWGIAAGWAEMTIPTPSHEEGEDQDEFQDLMAILEEETSIATQTKMNADFVPGMVTILHGNDLEAKGAIQVIDALTFVPGLNKSFNNISIRGIEKWGSGKIKVLLNGKAVNHSITANPTAPYLLPIQVVDRIEIVRGPGGAVYGEYAFLGVVNIITRKGSERLYGRYGSYDNYTGGLSYSHTNQNIGLGMSLNLSASSLQGERVMSGEDMLYQIGQADVSNAPGPVIDEQRQRAGIFTLDYQGWFLEANYLDASASAAFGMADALPPPDDRMIYDEPQWGVEVEKEIITSSLETSFQFGWSQYSMGMDKLVFFPAGIDFGWGSHTDGVVGSTFAQEQQLYGGMDTVWTGLKHHTISVGLKFSVMKLVDSWADSNFDIVTLEPTAWHRAEKDESWIKKGVKRRVSGLVIQDQYAVTNQFDITAGVRFDHYDDVGNTLAPRLGLVYRMTGHHVFKAQYGRAFRPPTFLEMYSDTFFVTGNPQMDPEVIDTYELGYIYRATKTVGRITVFHSKLKNMIEQDDSRQFQNMPGADLTGIELEMEHNLTNSLKLESNIFYVDTKDKTTSGEIADSANWLGNAVVLFQPQPDYSLALRYRYIGKRNRSIADTRNKLGEDSTIHLTGTIRHLWSKNLTLRASVDNLLDADVYQPAAPTSYPNDYPRPGRSWSLTMIYDY